MRLDFLCCDLGFSNTATELFVWMIQAEDRALTVIHLYCSVIYSTVWKTVLYCMYCTLFYSCSILFCVCSSSLLCIMYSYIRFSSAYSFLFYAVCIILFFSILFVSILFYSIRSCLFHSVVFRLKAFNSSEWRHLVFRRLLMGF